MLREALEELHPSRPHVRRRSHRDVRGSVSPSVTGGGHGTSDGIWDSGQGGSRHGQAPPRRWPEASDAVGGDGLLSGEGHVVVAALVWEARAGFQEQGPAT